MSEQTTQFDEHCMCCDKPAKIIYKGERFSSIECGCPIRISIRAEEDQEFIRRIRAAKDLPVVEAGESANG